MLQIVGCGKDSIYIPVGVRSRLTYGVETPTPGIIRHLWAGVREASGSQSVGARRFSKFISHDLYRSMITYARSAAAPCMPAIV